jgi:pimeloyl-ACP methyl ester carboxylesterase
MTTRLVLAAMVISLLLSFICAGCPGGDSGDPVPDVAVGDVASDTEQADSKIELDVADTYTDTGSPVESYPGEPGAMGIFLKQRESFYDQPFPCNTRLRPNGMPDLQDYPNPVGLELIKEYIKLAETRIDGFSNNGAIYFRFDSALDPARLPSPEETLDSSADLFLVNVSEESDFYGEYIPVEIKYWDQEAPYEGYYLEPYLLMIRPLGGFPMRPGDTYACVVTRRITDPQDRHLSQSETVGRALSDETGAPFYSMFGPVRRWLEQTTGISPADVAIATVFKVQNPVQEMISAAEYIRNEVEIELVGPVEDAPNGNSAFKLYYGAYLAPNFQTGEPPYETEGEIVFDSDGTPKVQWMEKITFALTLPEGKSMPAQGWPLVMYSHGTGGSYKGFVKNTAARFAEQGIAVIGIDQPLHGERYHGPGIDIEFYSFNFTNPWVARSLFRQAGLDFVSLSKLMQKMTFSVAGKAVKFNPQKLGYFGHSQGGLTGALYLAVAKNLAASVLSGAGGGLSYTILLRKELDSGTYFDIASALQGVLMLVYEDELDLFHPVLTLAQTLVEATDPINYSPLYGSHRVVDEPVTVLITEGVLDPYTPAVTTENLAIAGGIPPLSPVVHSHEGFAIAGLDGVKLPVSHNLQTDDGKSYTSALAQFSDYGHFVAFDEPVCINYYLSLFSSTFAGQPPTIAK